MNPRRVCVVVSARASYSRVRSLLAAIQAHAGLELRVVLMASALLQRFGGVTDVMLDDGIRVDARVWTVLEGHEPATMATSTGLAIVKLVGVFETLRPDLVLTVADRYETLATATAAAYLNLPLAHLLGGELTGSIDEKVRHAVTKLANYHFVSSRKAAARVLAMGEDPGSVFVTGCPSIDLAAEAAALPAPAEIAAEDSEVIDLRERPVVVLQHSVTTEYEQAGAQMRETLEAVRDTRLPAIVLHSNEDAGCEKIRSAVHQFRQQEVQADFRFLNALGPIPFLQLLLGARSLVGNSSVGIRECAFLGVPVVNVGTRQQGRERAENVVDVPHQREEIRREVLEQSARGRFPSSPIYGTAGAGERIAGMLGQLPLTVEKRFVG